jgi:lysophospholipase L1-like esterase
MFLSALASRRSMRRAVAIAAAAAAIGGTFAATSASAATSARPVQAGSAYLALGDSVPFGFREPNNLPTPNYMKPGTFTGFPKMVAQDLNLRLKNAACPGETTSSFIDPTAQSNGCENPAPGSSTPGYRQAGFPLHVKYTGSQLAYAVHFLKTHPGTRLVSIMLGANDGLVCQEENGGDCSGQNLAKTLDTIHANLDKIFSKLRGTGYKGQIVVVNYYSNNYADPQQTALVQGLNQVIDGTAKPYDVKISSTLRLWRYAADQSNGDDCAAGLLTILHDPSSGDIVGCGVHPSLGGHALIASAVERVLDKA